MARFSLISARGVCAVGGLLLTASLAHGAAITDGLYALSNHPDASQGPPGYGLRLDDLIDVTSGKDVFTFDFDDAQSDVRMEIDGSSIRIFGQVFGGLDIGTTYDDDLSGLWAIDFTYDNVVKMPNDNDYWVPAGSPTNTGTITALFGGFGSTTIFDYAGGHAYTLRLGDENSDDGHRGFDGISGWGWMAYENRGHINSSDWLFTATPFNGPPPPPPPPHPIPLPPGVLLGAAGLLGVAGLRLKRRFDRADT